ncbi:hypothetical protein BCV70DRAFT_202842 [Testicularia cyperi]|uniref:Uncharacterized protein n=1 Tax=Testicularia cyperi TaxID=1882483 RepID=A0A317XJF5_9BASI|nr:hypothetical protein BCV70DRAFT_202842 [Testicularia cyperi]
MATVDCMICAQGPSSASVTGGNGGSRDFLAGVLTVPAMPCYQYMCRSKGRNLEYASTILFCISLVLVIAVYVIYWKGPVLRKRSPVDPEPSNERKTAAAEGHHLPPQAVARLPTTPPRTQPSATLVEMLRVLRLGQIRSPRAAAGAELPSFAAWLKTVVLCTCAYHDCNVYTSLHSLLFAHLLLDCDRA